MTPAETGTVIGRSMKIDGDLTGDADLSVEGRIAGTIRLPAAQLTVLPEGRVVGSIVAKNVIVFGRIDGDIRATGRVDLRAGSVLAGDIFSSSISIEEGATLRCRLDPSRAAEPLPAAAPAGTGAKASSAALRPTAAP